MRKIFNFFLFFNMFFCLRCVSNSSSDVIQNSSAHKSFEKDFLKIFPYFDFADEDLYSIIAFFRLTVRSNNFSRTFKKLDALQNKYSNEFDLLQRIFFFKYVLCYVFNNPQKYSETNLQYSKIADRKFFYFKKIQKLNYLFRDLYYSNCSDYCIEMKQKDYDFLYKINSNDEYIDLLRDLMMLNKELLFLNFLIQILNSSYSMSWIESLWYSVSLINEEKSSYSDVYYYHVIEFFCSQGLEDEVWPLYQELCNKFPNSRLIEVASKFFEKK